MKCDDYLVNHSLAASPFLTELPDCGARWTDIDLIVRTTKRPANYAALVKMRFTGYRITQQNNFKVEQPMKRIKLLLLVVPMLMLANFQAKAIETDPYGVTQFLNPGVSPPQRILAPQQDNQVPDSVQSVAPSIDPQAPQLIDYKDNLNSDVFGANLFTGAFAREGATQFNPDYAVAIGDNVQVRFWGAYEYDATLTVDPKGNLFLPHVGPVQVMGVRNQDLQRVVESEVSKVFRKNVNSYASLASAQPVRVFVSGFVNRPGLYRGTSMDSLLHYLDQAGGIDPERGSFLNVQVKRGQYTRAVFNLYDFLLKGRIPLIQLSDGDVIFVAPRQNTVKVSGLAENAKRFEFNNVARSIATIAEVAKPLAQATHVRVVRNTGTVKNVEYYPLSMAALIDLQNGDEIEFTADKKPGTITVRVEGEHLSVQEYVLPYGSRMSALLNQIQFSERSDQTSLQLFRKSVYERQKEMLQTTLRKLETSVLTARSGTAEESQLRDAEAKLILQWIDRAKNIEPTGQVMITEADDIGDLLLENGDIIKVPALDNLVLVSGEVLFPNTIAMDSDKSVEDYINLAGGFSQDADTSRIIIAHRDGSFEDVDENSGWFSSDIALRPGDEILVLPKVDVKARQIFKEVTQMIYQIALAARVAIAF